MSTTTQIGNNLTSTTLSKVGTAIGVQYLSDNIKYFEPARSNTFEFYTTGLKSKLPTAETDSYLTDLSKFAYDNADDVIRLSVKSSSVPHFSISKNPIHRGNSTMYFAGRPEFKDSTIVINDFIGSGVKDLLMAWQRLAYNPTTEKVGFAADYKLDAWLLEYTPDFQLIRKWKLQGCWISELSEDNFDQETSDLRKITATIVCDKAYIDTSDLTSDSDTQG